MRLSELFTHTIRENPKNEVIANARLLTRGGFIFKNLAGVYSFLPLGLRVLKKVEQIIREEMDAIGGQELHMNILQDKQVWEKTGRWAEAREVMYQFSTRGLGRPSPEPTLSSASADSGSTRSTDLPPADGGGTMPDQSARVSSLGPDLALDKDTGLGFTHEEVVAQIASQYIQSYRDLPKYVYQIQTKFRNEPRAQAGILRGREFPMKDLYSLTADEKQLDEFYERCADAYIKIFQRLGLQAIRTKASGGLFSKYSDEFQVITEVGEDTIFVCGNCGFAINKEIADENPKAKIQKSNKIQNPNINCPKCQGKMIEHHSIEVGNIFKLGTRFSEPLGLYFSDQDGSRKPVIMGSYGIGTGRAMGTVVEVHHDERGIIWPESVAPYQVHLVEIPSTKSQTPNKFQAPNPKLQIERLYDQLVEAGVEVLYDDREDVSAGEKFADADLIGCPWRVVVSEKTIEKQSVEFKKRSSNDAEIVSLSSVIKKVTLLIPNL